VLAAYLVEHLPFETSPHQVIDTVRIVLQPGLLDSQTLLRLWNRAKSDNTYYVGFLEAVPDALPETMARNRGRGPANLRLSPCWRRATPMRGNLLACYRFRASAFWRPATMFCAVRQTRMWRVPCFRAIGAYFGVLRQDPDREDTLENALSLAEQRLAHPDAALEALLLAMPQYRAVMRALLVLAEVGEFTVAPILVRTTAIGSLMRRKLEPVTELVLEQVAVLQAADSYHLTP